MENAGFHFSIVGNSFRLVFPNGEYTFNKLDTIRAFVNGEIINPRTMRPQTMLRAVKNERVLNELLQQV